MKSKIFSQPDWFKALILKERAAISVNRFTGEPEMAAQGQQRLTRWVNEPQFSEESIFEQRLAMDGLDISRFEKILGTPVAEFAKSIAEHPRWLSELMTAYAQPAAAYADLEPGEEELGFLELIQPLVDQALARLQTGIAELLDRWPERPFDPEIIEDILLMNLPDPLLLRLGRTLTLELNVARLQGLLQGQTREERFRSFIEYLRLPEFSTQILVEYPVLARQLVICIDQWVEVSLEFLGRLCASRQAIVQHFNDGSDLGVLVELVAGAGDTHRGGRSVMIAYFDSGFQIVYKPKSMAVDVHFQQLLDWFNDRGCDPPLQTMKILDCREYGWVEFVAYQSCQDVVEVERFYRRLGIYLALLYAINASDFHLENIIAAGEHPLLIDLETLFNPEFERFDDSEAALSAGRAMLESVLVAGMLPQRLWSGDDYGGLDISGFGGEEGQLTPDRIPRPEDVGTDEMRYIREQIELSAEANRPSINDVPVKAMDYVPEVIAGFRHMYHLILDQRPALLASGGPLNRFAQDETRVLLRPTRTYDQLLFESFHPDTLRDALDRDLLFDRLWLVVSERSFMAAVIAAEQDELGMGDIPVFTTTPASLDLGSGSGEQISGVLTTSGMTLARRRIKKMDETDLARQEWFIHCSLATLTPYEFGIDNPPKAPYQLLDSSKGLDRRRFLDGARSAAERLAATAVTGTEDVSWIGLEQLPGGQWDISPAGMDFNNGIPGIGLFLAYAGLILEEPRYTDLARRAAAGMIRYLTLMGELLPGIGAFEGWGGFLYVLTHMGVLWDDPPTRDHCLEVVDVMAGFVADETLFDVYGGMAGAIGSLLAFRPYDTSGRALDTAVRCGDHLLQAAEPMEGGLGWANPDWGQRPLAGFAHGASGIGWALLELARISGKDRFKEAGLDAFGYERSLYSSQVKNWPDLRENDRANGSDPRFSVAWCHGAAGIGLARLRALAGEYDPVLMVELEISLQTTRDYGYGQSHCLCHGDLGNLDLLLTAGKVLDDPYWQKQAGHTGGMILESIERDGWFCGGPGGVEMPGLMLGIAGIGYQLLRLAEPDKVPSLLTLSPPRRE